MRNAMSNARSEHDGVANYKPSHYTVELDGHELQLSLITNLYPPKWKAKGWKIVIYDNNGFLMGRDYSNLPKALRRFHMINELKVMDAQRLRGLRFTKL